MKITNKKLLDNFLEKHANAIHAVNRWIEIIETNEFRNHNELKVVFPSVDYIGNGRYVFNIKRNNYRLIVLAVFIYGRSQIRFCGTHAEYAKIKNIKNI